MSKPDPTYTGDPNYIILKETPDVDIDNTGKPYPITDELLICLLLLVFIIAIESKLND